jgi:hypothetical protein
VRIGPVLVLVVAVLGPAGCGQSSPSAPPSPASTPAAVNYADPAALYAAIEKAGSPKVEGLAVGTFSDAMPKAAHAAKGNFMVAISSDRYNLYLSDGSPATSMVMAVFPDAAARKSGSAFGQHMAGSLGWPSIWQLQGPNWLLWGVDEQDLRGIQGAIGGALGRTPAITASPGAAT